MISLCILAKNAQETLGATLDSAKSFSEIVFLDTGSTDQTLIIAENYPNVKIFQIPFKGFGPLRNEAAAKAKNDWILALDCDEVLSPPLLREIAALSLDPTYAYSIPRHNFYNGKQIKGCGWHPEQVVRLYHRKQTHFSDSLVHEALIAQSVQKLRSPLLHTPFRSTAEFLAKMQHYSTLFASQNQSRKKSSFTRAVFHGLFAFVRSYFLKRGIFDGKEGLIISLYNANTTFYKYIKLDEMNRSQ